MIIHDPRIVRFGDIVLENVSAIMIDRTGHRVVEEFGDHGPYPTFADVPEQRVHIRVIQEAMRDGVNAPKPGDQATLSFYTAATAGDSGRQKVTAEAVVLSVEHEISIRKGALRTIRLTAVSANGESDPIMIDHV